MLITFLDGSQREVAFTPGADLYGADLHGADLIGANLNGTQGPRRAGTGFKKAKELPLP